MFVRHEVVDEVRFVGGGHEGYILLSDWNDMDEGSYIKSLGELPGNLHTSPPPPGSWDQLDAQLPL